MTAMVERLLPDDIFGPSGVQAGFRFSSTRNCGSLGRAPSTVPGATLSQALRASLGGMQTWVEERHMSFQGIPPSPRDDLLLFLDTAGEPSFNNVPARVFFETFLKLAKAGYLQSLAQFRASAQAPRSAARAVMSSRHAWPSRSRQRRCS